MEQHRQPIRRARAGFDCGRNKRRPFGRINRVVNHQVWCEESRCYRQRIATIQANRRGIHD